MLDARVTLYRHPREGGDPVPCGISGDYWIPAFAGMTTEPAMTALHRLPAISTAPAHAPNDSGCRQAIPASTQAKLL